MVLRRTCFLAIVLTTCSSSGWPQGLAGLAGTKPAAAAAAPATDPLGRGTPRDAIRNFLESCHAQQFARAAEYLDLSKLKKDERIIQGPQLARELGLLLDHDTHFELGKLDNTALGKSEDALPSDIDLLNTFEMDNATYPLYLQRMKQNGLELWLVSADSVMQISGLNSLIGPSPFEKFVPAPLVKTAFLGTALWVWMALILAAIVISAVSRFLSRLAIAVLKPIVKRFTRVEHSHRWESFTEPIRVLVSAAVFRAFVEIVAPSAILRDYILKLLVLLTLLGAAALVMRFVDLISDQITSRLDPRQRALSYSVLPLGVRVAKIFIFCIAVLAILAQWGYNTSTIVAGLGVGGLAVALAAQKTIENLFGGISVISDRPVLVGDTCQFGGQIGTIEDIGLRSTRIRTAERTVVTIPNSQFSTMTLENYSKRDRMLFKPTLKLRRGTSPDEITKAIDGVVDILKSYPSVDPTDVPVRFTKLAPESFDLDIFSYVLTTDGNDFLRVQTDLLLKIMKMLEEINVVLAVPVTENIIASSDGIPDRPFRVLDASPQATTVGNNSVSS